MWPGSRIIEIHWLAALSNTKCTQLRQTRHSESVGALYGKTGVCAPNNPSCLPQGWGVAVVGELPTWEWRKETQVKYKTHLDLSFHLNNCPRKENKWLCFSSTSSLCLSWHFFIRFLFFLVSRVNFHNSPEDLSVDLIWLCFSHCLKLMLTFTWY